MTAIFLIMTSNFVIADMVHYIVNARSLTLFKQLLDEHWTIYLMIDVCEQDSQAVPFFL